MPVRVLPPFRQPSTEAKPHRKLIGRALQEMRAHVFSEQRYRCSTCNKVTAYLELDHIIPLHRGGTDERRNLQGLCAGGDSSCHAKKTAEERGRRDGK